MPSNIIRPVAASSSTGWQTSGNVIANSFDADNATYAQQSNVTCNATYTFGQQEAGIEEAAREGTLSVTISAHAKGGRVATTSAALKLIDSTGSDVAAAETESWGTTLSTQTTTAITTQAGGSAPLTLGYIHNCTLNIVPDGNGIFLHEIFITISYDLKYMAKVNSVTDGDISKVSGTTNANMAEINGLLDTD